MIDLGVPVIPGSHPLQDVETALAAGEAIGYPLMLKASAGGGGKGIRKLTDAAVLKAELRGPKRRLKRRLAIRRCILEKSLSLPNTSKFRFYATCTGIPVFSQNDCSLQRHSQKMVEESPCPVLTSPERRKLLHLAATIAEGVDYLNAGTIEFLMDQQHHFISWK